MKTEAIHQGLECGHVAESHVGTEIISVGPTMESVRTPRERAHASSLERMAVSPQALLRDLEEKAIEEGGTVRSLARLCGPRDHAG